MRDPGDVLGALADVFTWIGVGGAVVLGLVALAAWVADGTWLPARGVVEPVEAAHVVRWIDDTGAVNEAPLSHHDLVRLAGRDMADIYYRRGRRNRMRLTRGACAVHLLLGLAAGFAGLGIVAFGGSLLLAAQA